MFISNFLSDLQLVILVFLPAGIANMVPVFAAKLPLLKKFNAPADLNLTFRGKRLLGENKTIRGFIVGTLVAGLVFWVESMFWDQPQVMTIQPYFAGMLLGFGALFGDAVKSFFKRQFEIAPGKSWFPFDQLDFILGAILFSLLFMRVSLTQYILAIVFWALLHLLTVLVGYFLHIRDSAI